MQPAAWALGRRGLSDGVALRALPEKRQNDE